MHFPLPISQIHPPNSKLLLCPNAQPLMCQASSADAEQITEMKAAVPSTSHLAAGQGTAPEHLLDLRRLPAHSQLDQSRNPPYLLSHLLVVALPCQFVLVLGSLQKRKQNSGYRDQAVKKQPGPEGNEVWIVQEEKKQIKWENPHRQKIILGLNMNRAKYPQSAPKTSLC